ncbi:MAG: gluconate 2-dehydrogenase subunit 3 family protein [Dehalococcoidia bacterium]
MAEDAREQQGRSVSRRDFLRSSAYVAAGAGIVGVTGLTFRELTVDDTISDGIVPDQSFAYADNVLPAPGEVRADVLGFFTPDEARTTEAFVARLMPGTPDDPGAREAGVLTFIDTRLSMTDTGFWAATYFRPPFAETYEGDSPPEDDGYRHIYIEQSEFARYGFQSRLTPREAYRAGIVALNQYARSRFDDAFVDLSEDDQDAVIEVLADEDAEVDEFTEPSAKAFFDMLREDTVYGMFADPAYGGNRDLAGWKLIGYPGPQRGYTPVDLMSEDPPRQPQALADLHPFDPGVRTGDVVLPVSEADHRDHRLREAGR